MIVTSADIVRNMATMRCRAGSIMATIAVMMAIVTACDSGSTTAKDDCPAPAGDSITLRANATPAQEVAGGRVGLSSATDTEAVLYRDPGPSKEIRVKVGDSFEVGLVRYRLLAACSVHPPKEQPGSTRAIAYIRAE